MVRKASLEEYIDAIVARHEGMPYTEVLSKFDLTPHQFGKAVLQELPKLARRVGEARETLLGILLDRESRVELLYMGEQFLAQQYENMISGRQIRFHEGTFQNHANRDFICYYALGRHNPLLRSRQRRKVIRGIESLPVDVTEYFRKILLFRLMNRAYSGNKANSPLSIFESFDKVYQDKTGEESLFNLSQKLHLHKWDVMSKSSRNYFDNKAHVREAVDHLLVENYALLSSSDPSRVSACIEGFPAALRKYFYCIKIGQLIQCSNGELSVQECFRMFSRALSPEYRAKALPTTNQ